MYIQIKTTLFNEKILNLKKINKMIFRDVFSVAFHKVFLRYRITLLQIITLVIIINTHNANTNTGIFILQTHVYSQTQ